MKFVISNLIQYIRFLYDSIQAFENIKLNIKI